MWEALATIGGAALSGGSSALSSYLSWKWQKQAMKNRHQWEVEDLKKAGLNPILSAGGSGAVGNAPTANIDLASGAERGWNAAMQKQSVESAVDLQKAQVRGTDANTAHTLSEVRNSNQDFRIKQMQERQLQASYVGQLVSNANALLSNKIAQQYTDYLSRHPNARDAGFFMKSLNPNGSAAPFVNSAASLIR